MFSFFWKGKPDLVARKVVCQPTSLGGFGVVSIELKACALLVQWIRRLVTKPASWVHFFYYYCWHRYGCSSLDVLSRPSSLDLSLLPPFYNSLLAAWQKVNGGFRTGLAPWLYALLVVSFNRMFRRYLQNSCIPTFCPPLT